MAAKQRKSVKKAASKTNAKLTEQARDIGAEMLESLGQYLRSGSKGMTFSTWSRREVFVITEKTDCRALDGNDGGMYCTQKEVCAQVMIEELEKYRGYPVGSLCVRKATQFTQIRGELE